MKAVLLTRFGGLDVLRLSDVPTPSPAPGEILVRVHAVSVNRTWDLEVRRDGGGYGVTLPMVLGFDPSGVVEALGDGVAGFGIGDRVTVVRTVNQGGGAAEYIAAPANRTFHVPDAVSFAEATVVSRHFPMAFGLARRAQLQAGEWALVMGAAGALGSCAVQVAKHLGALVVAAAGSTERVRAALDLGADAGVDYRRQDLAAEVMRVTGGKGVGVVFENIGDPELWPGAFDSLGQGGRLVTVGAHAGGVVPLDVKRLYWSSLQVIGGLGGAEPGDVDRALELMAAGTFRVLVDRVLSLREVAEAHRLVADRELLGKVILDPTLV